MIFPPVLVLPGVGQSRQADAFAAWEIDNADNPAAVRILAPGWADVPHERAGTLDPNDPRRAPDHPTQPITMNAPAPMVRCTAYPTSSLDSNTQRRTHRTAPPMPARRRRLTQLPSGVVRQGKPRGQPRADLLCRHRHPNPRRLRHYSRPDRAGRGDPRRPHRRREQHREVARQGRPRTGRRSRQDPPWPAGRSRGTLHHVSIVPRAVPNASARPGSSVWTWIFSAVESPTTSSESPSSSSCASSASASSSSPSITKTVQ